VHNVGAGAAWQPFRIPGFIARDTTINAGTRGVASVMVARPDGGPVPETRHAGDILFTFVMAGSMTLEGEGTAPSRLSPGDAFVIPPGMATRYAEATADLELLGVSRPGVFVTQIAWRLPAPPGTPLATLRSSQQGDLDDCRRTA